MKTPQSRKQAGCSDNFLEYRTIASAFLGYASLFAFFPLHRVVAKDSQKWATMCHFGVGPASELAFHVGHASQGDVWVSFGSNAAIDLRLTSWSLDQVMPALGCDATLGGTIGAVLRPNFDIISKTPTDNAADDLGPLRIE